MSAVTSCVAAFYPRLVYPATKPPAIKRAEDRSSIRYSYEGTVQYVPVGLVDLIIVIPESIEYTVDRHEAMISVASTMDEAGLCLLLADVSRTRRKLRDAKRKNQELQEKLRLLLLTHDTEEETGQA